jgi:ElaB/YqjD/DUF883 family membrane-anchored ribosome-binding protein
MNTRELVNGGPIQHTLERGAEKATVAAHDTIDSAAEATRPAIDHMVANAHETVDRAGVAAAHAAEALGIKGDQLNESSQRIIERASVYVRENPVASLGMAVAAGYVISRLLSSR